MTAEIIKLPLCAKSDSGRRFYLRWQMRNHNAVMEQSFKSWEERSLFLSTLPQSQILYMKAWERPL